MKPEHSQPGDKIFQAALDLSGEKRESYLREACGGDEELRRERKTPGPVGLETASGFTSFPTAPEEARCGRCRPQAAQPFN